MPSIFLIRGYRWKELDKHRMSWSLRYRNVQEGISCIPPMWDSYMCCHPRNRSRYGCLGWNIPLRCTWCIDFLVNRRRGSRSDRKWGWTWSRARIFSEYITFNSYSRKTKFWYWGCLYKWCSSNSLTLSHFQEGIYNCFYSTQRWSFRSLFAGSFRIDSIRARFLHNGDT